MSVEDYPVSFSLEVNVEKAYEDIRKLETVLYRALGMLRQMGAGPDLDRMITQIQRAIAMINQLRLTIIALQAASGPIGWALAGIGVVSTLVLTGDFIGSVNYDGTRGR